MEDGGQQIYGSNKNKIHLTVPTELGNAPSIFVSVEGAVMITIETHVSHSWAASTNQENLFPSQMFFPKLSRLTVVANTVTEKIVGGILWWWWDIF